MHWKGRFVEQSHKSHWLRSLDIAPGIRILDSGSGPWEESERFWIRFYRDEVGLNLTNASDGGESNDGWTHTPEIRKKISERTREAMKAVNHELSERQKRGWTPEARLKIALSNSRRREKRWRNSTGAQSEVER